MASFDPRRRGISRWSAVAVIAAALGWWGTAAAGCASGEATTDDDDGAGNAGNTGGGGSTSTGSTTTTTSTTTSTTTGTGGGTPCPEDPCRLTPPQCGCGFDEKCSVGADGPECVQDGTIDGGEQCLGSGCQAGYVCAGFVAPPETCHQFCDDDGDCQGPGGVCALELTIGGTTEYTITLCSENCDPIANTGCVVPGMRCDVALDEGPPERHFTLCLPAGDGGQQEPCTGLEDCAVGLSCFTVNSESVCVTWCDRSDPQCPVGSCYPTDPPTLVGSTEYGVCYAG